MRYTFVRSIRVKEIQHYKTIRTKMKAYDRLLEHNIKPSMQRIAIMDYLMDHHTHPSVDEIYSSLFPSMPTLSKTTVYNTLKLFADQGAVRMLTIDEHNALFDVVTSPHSHFLCKRCGHVLDVMHENVYDQKGEIKELDGNLVMEEHHYFKGICKRCLDQEQQMDID
jgi:Fur family ferric uptake transcriptional regulator/Fur family peroxide stress response transcriptional regulator